MHNLYFVCCNVLAYLYLYNKQQQFKFKLQSEQPDNIFMFDFVGHLFLKVWIWTWSVSQDLYVHSKLCTVFKEYYWPLTYHTQNIYENSLIIFISRPALLGWNLLPLHFGPLTIRSSRKAVSQYFNHITNTVFCKGQ